MYFKIARISSTERESRTRAMVQAGFFGGGGGGV